MAPRSRPLPSPRPPRAPAPRLSLVPVAMALTVALVLVVALILSVALAAAAELNGPAQVVDGNRVTIGSQMVRLYGIDAPDENQTCERRGASWRCGQEAGWALAERLERHWVLCDTRAASPDDEAAADAVPAVCYLEGRQIDVNAWMVAQGWALADRKANLYVGEEQAAQRAGRGLWSGKFDPPWVWREKARQ